MGYNERTDKLEFDEEVQKWTINVSNVVES